MALFLVALVGYLAFIGYDGSQTFAAHDRSGDCRTPASAFGWAYEAINYDLASDQQLDAFPDRAECPSPGEAAGPALTASDGVRIAGWYIPAGSGNAAAPTVVLAHGNGKAKSEMLSWAEPLHADYNLVLLTSVITARARATSPRSASARSATCGRLSTGWSGPSLRRRSRSWACQWAAQPPLTRPSRTSGCPL